MNKDKLINVVRSEGLDSFSDIIIFAMGVVFPVAAIGTMVSKSIVKLIASRTHVYKSSLANDIINQLDLLSQDEEFVQMFYLTYQSALKAHNDEKASASARLLNNCYKDNVEVDELFEFNEIMSRLSVRDILYLEKLKEMPKGEHESEEDFAEQLKEWKSNLELEFDKNLTYIDSLYLKLQGYGFCQKWSHRSFLGQRFNEFWELTPYYLSFSYFIRNKETDA